MMGKSRMSHELVIDLPVLAYQHLQQVAARQQRAVGEVASDLILAELPTLPSLPQDIEQELDAFAQLSNEVLTLLANTTLSEHEQTELARLNAAGQARSLSIFEETQRQHLLDAYDRVLVRRAQAALILRLRGQIQSPLQ